MYISTNLFIMNVQSISLATNRSDYMLDYPSGTAVSDSVDFTNLPNIDFKEVKLRQVEFNTIASSFAGLSQNLCSYHR